MDKLTWSIDSVSNIGRVYLRNVLGNMRRIEGSYVQFGLLGKGITPNYQVTFPNGTVRCLRGMNHKVAELEDFNSMNISQEFTLKDIELAFERARSV